MYLSQNQQLVRLLKRAEGYLTLNLPQRAAEILDSRDDWPGHGFKALLLTGKTLKQLGHHAEAIAPLERAAALRPHHPEVAVALGWCYKRTHRLAQAIATLESCLHYHHTRGVLHYNLACYWCLAGDPTRALNRLTTAIGLNPRYLHRMRHESDFQSIRNHPGFQSICAKFEGLTALQAPVA